MSAPRRVRPRSVDLMKKPAAPRVPALARKSASWTTPARAFGRAAAAWRAPRAETTRRAADCRNSGRAHRRPGKTGRAGFFRPVVLVVSSAGELARIVKERREDGGAGIEAARAGDPVRQTGDQKRVLPEESCLPVPRRVSSRAGTDADPDRAVESRFVRDDPVPDRLQEPGIGGLERPQKRGNVPVRRHGGIIAETAVHPRGREPSARETEAARFSTVSRRRPAASR